MAVGPSSPLRGEPPRGEPPARVRPLLEALTRTEDNIVMELSVRSAPAHDSHELGRAAEGLTERLETFAEQFDALAQRLERAQRDALQHIAADMTELRGDLRVYTAVMAVAVIAVVLLLAVMILFKIR
ncbi:MAG: hypothetical protein HYU88_10785 [Chloroflexi bacterium]|nr:hypothetical protein [Chloroflexota bacterium]MBI4505262.1 hypothetical protein [Chloroflexota bacterium]